MYGERTRRVTGRTRMWLETAPPKPLPQPIRLARKCDDCETWVLGADKTALADRLAQHRRTCHG